MISLRRRTWLFDIQKLGNNRIRQSLRLPICWHARDQHTGWPQPRLRNAPADLFIDFDQAIHGARRRRISIDRDAIGLRHFADLGRQVIDALGDRRLVAI